METESLNNLRLAELQIDVNVQGKIPTSASGFPLSSTEHDS